MRDNLTYDKGTEPGVDEPLSVDASGSRKFCCDVREALERPLTGVGTQLGLPLEPDLFSN